MTDIGAALLEKLDQLATVAVEGRPLHAKGGRFPSSPAALLEEAASLADSVRRMANPTGADEIRSLVLDFFDFLATVGARADHALESEAEFPPEPAHAWEETRSGMFWCFAALVHDVWEHAAADDGGVAQWVINLLASLPVRSVYDFGCGAGRYSVALAQRGLTVTCAERNSVKRQFVRHRRMLGRDLGGIRSRRPLESYDAALAINVLDHLYDPVPAVAALARRIRFHGVLVVVARFPGDEWHASGDIEAAAHQELMRYFTDLNVPTMSGVMLLVRCGQSECPHA